MGDQPLREVAYPHELRDSEKALLENRPKWSRASFDSKPQSVGFGLSGGGIRSATFCLGVFQALAKLKLLGEIDYVSSVSGGGYFAGLFGRIFTRDDVDSVEDVEAILSPDRAGQVLDPGPVRWKDGLFRWIRENGRYLAPKGGGDLLLGLAVMLRNWVSLQAVMMVFVLEVLLLSQLLRALFEEAGWLPKLSSMATGWFLWSPYILLAGAVVVVAAFPLGSAYWLIPQTGPEEGPGAGRQGLRWPPFAVLFFVITVALTYLVSSWLCPQCSWSASRGAHRIAWLALVVCGMALVFWYAAVVQSAGPEGAFRSPRDIQVKLYRDAQARNLTSATLRTSLAITFAIAAVALIDSAAQTAYVLTLCDKFHPYKWMVPLFTPVAAIAPFAKWIVSMISGDGKGKRFSPPLKLLASVGAALVIVPALIGMDAISYWVAFGDRLPANVPAVLVDQTPAALSPGSLTIDPAGISFKCGPPPAVDSGQDCKQTASSKVSQPRPGRLWRLVLALIGATILSLLFGITWPFINRSSLATIYTDRLTRAYLGASNPSRYEVESGAVSEVMQGDDITQSEYWNAAGADLYKKGAPIHLVNVTINETLDPASQLQQQDRKGIGMAQGPAGVSAGIRHHVVFQKSNNAEDQYRNVRTFPSDKNTYRMFDYNGNYEGQRLTVGKWIGISGAAVATGLGSLTNIGASLLTGFFNVRLGYWWNSGVDRKVLRTKPKPTQEIGRQLNRLFPVQTYLLDELLARFHGSARQHWYLTDGGHFENLGAYELIRRRLRLIVVIDAAADHDYVFEDLANLIRKARLDFGAEIRFLEANELTTFISSPAQKYFGTLEQLRRGVWSKEPVNDPTSAGRRLSVAADEDRLSLGRAALAYVTYDGKPEPESLLLLVKPTLTGDEPADVLRYHGANPSFPHQTTAEQFFDEAQWESYRKLGEHIAERLFQKVPPDGLFSPGAMRWD